jgi:NRPS condensation-like uncharacterized protein
VDTKTNRHYGETKWHRLDNTATIYPVISNRNLSSVYRVSARLKSEIVPELLQKALDQTMPWFESFQVRLRRGAFWYYFETNKKRPMISEERTVPCGYIDQASNNQFLFKVSYYKRRISLEVFHAVSDGTGAINFLKELTCRYLLLAHPEDSSAVGQELPSVDVTSDTEDSYIKNYVRSGRSGFSTMKAFQVQGEKLPLFTTGIIHGYLETESLLALCRRNHATITQYLAAVLVWCIYKEYLNEQPNPCPIMIFIPVNLRPFFGSTTTMNFFSYISVGMKIERSGYAFEEMLETVVRQSKEQLTKDLLSRKIAHNVALGKNLFARFLPLPVKNLVMRTAYARSNRAISITLSNLGCIEVPDPCRDHVEHFEVLINVTDKEPTKCAVCSFGGKMVVTFTSRLKNPYLQRAFFRKLAADGLEITIESNGAYHENM